MGEFSHAGWCMANEPQRKKKVDRLRDQRDQLNRQIRQLEAQQLNQNRKDETRRKVLIGAAIMARVQNLKEGWDESKLRAMMDNFLTRPKDRALFGLQPLAEGPKKQALGKGRNTAAADSSSKTVWDDVALPENANLNTAAQMAGAHVGENLDALETGSNAPAATSKADERDRDLQSRAQGEGHERRDRKADQPKTHAEASEVGVSIPDDISEGKNALPRPTAQKSDQNDGDGQQSTDINHVQQAQTSDIIHATTATGDERSAQTEAKPEKTKRQRLPQPDNDDELEKEFNI